MVSAGLKALYFFRAVAWMLLMVVLGLLVTVFEVLTFPAFYFLDPTHRVYQYLVCLIAQVSLYPVISVKVIVRGLRVWRFGAPAAAGCWLALPRLPQSLLPSPPSPPSTAPATP